MLENRKTPPRLNLAAIGASLEMLQRDLPDVIAQMDAEREPLNDEIRENMLAGYGFIDEALARQLDFFARGNSRLILELNNIVLYGSDPERRRRYSSSIEANEKRYYVRAEGGVGDLVESYRMHDHESLWNRCALLYIHMLGRPQLFIEGNHRTAVLVVSFLLAREGWAPFVLTADNAREFLQPSSTIGKSKRHSVRMALRRPRLKRYIAGLLKRYSNSAYLLPEDGGETCPGTKTSTNKARC